MAKKHLQNQTGTHNSFKPVKIAKNNLKKNMIHGNKIFLILFFVLIFSNFLKAEQKITSTPLINIDEIKPSFESFEEKKMRASTQIKI